MELAKQVTDTRNHWVTEIAGVRGEFDTEITEQEPDMRIAWCTIEGPKQSGVVTFHRIDDETTRVMLQMEMDPGSAAGLVDGGCDTHAANSV